MAPRIITAAVTALAVSAAHADVIFVGPTSQSGTGFGNVLNVLTLHATPQEAGSVLWQGSGDLRSGDATNQSQTRSVAELTAAGVGALDFGVVFNINEPGSSAPVTLQQFELVFQDQTGEELFTQEWTGSMSLMPLAQGQGTGGAGYLFTVNLTPAQASLFFSDPANRIGMRVESPILSTAGGPENFYLIPAPGALALLGLAVGALGRRRRS